MSTISLTADIDIELCDVLDSISDSDLLNEVSNRELLLSEQVNLNFDEWELIELICKNKSIIESDKIKSFFNQ